MSWSASWTGRATDFVPELLSTRGNPGPMAQAAAGAVFDALQTLGNQQASTFVRVTGHGSEDSQAGKGQLTIMIQETDEPSEIDRRLEAQQPVDLTV